MYTEKTRQWMQQDKQFRHTLNELLQSTLEALIQVTLLFCLGWYALANLLGTRMDVPMTTYSLIPVVIGSWLALKLLAGRKEVALAVWMIGLASMVGIAEYLFQRPEVILFLLPLPLLGALIVNWRFGLVVSAFLILEAWLLGQNTPGQPLSAIYLQVLLVGSLMGNAVGWVVSRSLLVASTWALEGYRKAQIEMDEARQNRMELKQIQEDLILANSELARLTDRLKIMYQVAEEARQVKEQFVANVSHELRTPLNMIISFSELIMQSPRSYGRELPPELLADIAAIQRNSRHLSKLVDDVLSLSQIDAGRMGLTREWASLAEIVQEAVTAVGVMYKSKNLFLETELSRDLPMIFCDSTRIGQVVLNLLSNAGRFTEQGGVRIKAYRDGEQVIVTVTDTGPGISPDGQTKVFQPFQQLDGLTQRHYGGSGLGLSISKNFVEMHGGKMWLESEVGKGTTFFFSLPVLEQVEPAWKPADATRWFNPYQTYEGRTLHYTDGLKVVPRFVVLESGQVLTQLIERYLAQVEVSRVDNIHDAIAELGRSPAQALLVNEASDLLTQETIQQIPNLPFGTPVITCWLASDDDVARQLGAVRYLVKPVRQEQLFGVLEEFGETIQTVLVVDDQPEALQLFARMLYASERKLRVLQADNARRALDLMHTRKPDLLLLDLIMPEMDGFQLLHEKELDPHIQDIPTIIISSQDPTGKPVVTDAIKVRRSDGLSVHELLTCIQAFSEILTPQAQPKGPMPPENSGG